jgi:hypothetical protein
MTIKPALQNILKRILQIEEEDKHKQGNRKNNLTRLVNKQMKIKKYLNVKTILLELLHAFL